MVARASGPRSAGHGDPSATNDASPYAQARTLRALFQLTGDRGADKLSFAPGKLDVTVCGLPPAPPNAPRAGGRWA